MSELIIEEIEKNSNRFVIDDERYEIILLIFLYIYRIYSLLCIYYKFCD